MPSPIRPTDDDARSLARALIAEARFAALGVTDPATGMPLVSRIACVPGPDGLPLALVSDLSAHTAALKADPACCLLLGEPGPRGDPLTHPRLSLQGRARFVRHGDADHPGLAAHYLARQPKAKLYIGFGDFALMRIDPTGAHLNGGFGKAFVLAPDDLRA
ncbi:pyridoxamine 5'-phosphate oxidase family protein [Thalassococcus sp. CAU 1522]|uniref:Pyridoxamine 5'-phosphate oxidase family protein n=1 Tax=Thalassococcus arenae TaxID=2851652 RepID=A0ABS6N516_9RHOB|nr:pyridoxamine 5'-phosphate oxidase family protein [Thalassococcus arenae]MBV2358772.1 pyridoxamine 5'-phosphate oxidase family protein [Thalassococcus arenae]